MTSTEQSPVTEQTGEIDTESITLAIDSAIAPRTSLPPHAELVDLERTLRQAIEQLLPPVQAATNRMFRGSTEWYVRQRRLDHSRTLLVEGAGDGLVSADRYVRDLGRACESLLKFHRKG